ncbi:MAG TPA: hypothetical protein VK540_01375, partial [Polyangiaceae bacterium]|nr:hypothetical protein [Polyangiaceae bacterium]
MRTVHTCLFLSALTGVFSCMVYDDALLAPRDELSPTSQTAGSGGSSATGTGSGGNAAGAANGAGAGVGGTGAAGTNGSPGTGGRAGTSGNAGAGGRAGTGGSAGTGGNAGSSGSAAGSAGTSGGAGASGNAGAGGSAGASGGAGAGGTGGGTPGRDSGMDGRVGTAGSGGIDGGTRNDGPAAGGSAGKDGATANDVTFDVTADTEEASVSDGPITGGWLHTYGNHLYLGSGIFHGRGANFHDTRSCNACAYTPANVAEVNRRADELVDNWKANFIRLDLENSLTADDRVQWQGVLDDPAYQADIQAMVTHVTSKGAYVLLALWDESTTTANDLPTEATNAVWRKLADMFK